MTAIEELVEPQMKRSLGRHKADRKAGRAARGASARARRLGGGVKPAGGIVAALMKSVVDMACGDKPGRNARDGYATCTRRSSYRMLERVARKAGDKHTAAVARHNREEEEAMARSIDSKWNKIVDLSLKEEGGRT